MLNGDFQKKYDKIFLEVISIEIQRSIKKSKRVKRPYARKHCKNFKYN